MPITVAAPPRATRQRLPVATSAAVKGASTTSGPDATTALTTTARPDQQAASSSAPISTRIVHATGDGEIPIALAAQPAPTSRGFLPWRLSDTGPGVCRNRRDGPVSETLHTPGKSQDEHIVSEEPEIPAELLRLQRERLIPNAPQSGQGSRAYNAGMANIAVATSPRRMQLGAGRAVGSDASLIPLAIFANDKIGPGAKLAYSKLLSYAAIKDTATNRRLAEDLAVSPRSVRNYISELKSAGLIKVRLHPGKPSTYQLTTM